MTFQIIFRVFIDFTIYVVPMTILSAHIDFEATCGIPMARWHVGLLAIILLSNLQKLMMYLVVQHCRASRFIYGIFSSGIIFTILFGWLLYGNVLFYSRKNNCIHLKETRTLSYLMLGYLYVGYIQIGYAISYVFIIPHAVSKWWQLKQR